MTPNRCAGPVRTDGGNDQPEHDDSVEDHRDEAVEAYPEEFGYGEPNEPDEGDAEGAYDEYSLPGYDGDPDPPFGLDPLTGRPLGPPCRDCDEPMTVESWGWTSTTGETVDWAICEACGLGWGPITEWVDLDGDSSRAKSSGASDE